MLVQTPEGVQITLSPPGAETRREATTDLATARRRVLELTRQIVAAHGDLIGRLTLSEADRHWEFAVPVDPGRDPVALSCTPGQDGIVERSSVATAHAGAFTSADADPPVLHAQLRMTAEGDCVATLTFPDPQPARRLTGDDLDDARLQVITTARGYLAATGRPGRLWVDDPAGRWRLGIPHDGAAIIELDDPNQ